MTEFDQGPVSPGDRPDDELDQALRTTLRTLSAQARQAPPPAPAGQIRSLGTRRRHRRTVASAALAAAAVVAAITVSVGGLPGALGRGPVTPAGTSTDQPVTTADTSDPTADPANDLGYLSGVQTAAGGKLVLIFDRVAVTDQQISNKNIKLRAFTTDSSALVGFTPAELSDRVTTSVLLLGHGPLVRLVHQGDADGVVTRLQELPTPAAGPTGVTASDRAAPN